MQPGFAVIHANQLETLTELTVHWLKEQPLAPLENEIVLVQSNGMAQWLKLKLAADQGCGISAAQSFQMPSRFLWQAYRLVLGAETVPVTSPFDKSRLLWRLMALLPECLALPDFQPLKQFLADDSDMRKRYQLAERLADLFDQYQVYRADWLALWEQGEEAITDSRGQPQPLPDGQRWQAQLWQRLIAAVPAEQQHSSRAHIHQAFIEALANGQPRSPLPRRIVVFGISSLPRQILEALHALSPWCQILMLVQNPCQYYWADIIEGKELLRQQQRQARKQAPASNPVEAGHGHPLLAAWGKQGRDYIGLLSEHDVPEQYQHWFQQIDLFSHVTERHSQPDSLLARLQQSILELEPLPASPEAATPDHSIRFHRAHSPQREVEILHDQLLAAFEHSADSEHQLQPRDVVVMVPDIERYAPHIDAVFGNASGERAIPYTLSDRRQRHQQPLAIAVESLLELPRSRFTVSNLLDLLDVPALRQRFAFSETELPALRDWIRGAGIRWGLHSEQRAQLDLPAGQQQNSWLFGLQRMLLGYAVGDGQAWQGIEPYPEVGGLQAALAGQLHALLSALQHHWQQLSRPATVDHWVARLQAMLADLFQLDSDEDIQLHSALLAALEHWQEACNDADYQEQVPLSVVKETWLSALDQGGLSQRFLAGRVNFCTLMPMRSIPFPMVCMLGMNDGDYPRTQLPVDFDLMASAGQYRPGDRSRRDDDRYLFLEALLSARQQLHLSWVGQDIRDNHERPPSVLIAQLRDYLDSRWQYRSDRHSGLVAALTVDHPLQPFSRRYYDGLQAELFSYEPAWQQALAQSEQALPVAGASPASLVAPQLEAPQVLSPAQLARFLKQPAQLFFNERLKVRFTDEQDSEQDNEPFVIDSLDRHQLQSHLLEAVSRVTPEQQPQAFAEARKQLLRSGQLPIGYRGETLLDEQGAQVWQAIEQWLQALQQWPHALPVAEVALSRPVTELPGIGQLEINDWLGDLYAATAEPVPGDSLCRLVLLAGDIHNKPHRWLNDWLRHLCACAAGLPITSQLIGADGKVTLEQLQPERACALLDDLLRGWQQALCQPLPVAPKTALQWLTSRDNLAQGKGRSDPLEKAREQYHGNYRSRGEVDYGNNPALRRAFPDFDQLLAIASPVDSSQPGFCYWAETLYQPLRQHSEQEAPQ